MGVLRVVVGFLLLAFPLGLSAANRVGDANNDQSQDMGDAALVQSRLYGAVSASAVSPLALADGDATLGLGDLLYVAQIATGARTGVTPQPALLTITPPSPASYVSGIAPNPVLGFSVVSNYPDATLVGGLDALDWSISSALSTLANSDMSVAGSMANTELDANNPGPGADVFDVGLVIDVADSDGALAQQATANEAFTVIPAGFCASQPNGTVCQPAAGPCDLDDTCQGGVCVDNGVIPLGITEEFIVCADSIIGGNCGAVSCTGDTMDQATAIGSDCSDTTGTLSMSRTFSVLAGGLYKVWIRVGLDDAWDFGEQYNCDLDGSPFSFTESDLDSGTYGVNCTLNASGNYCWAAAFTNTPVNLTPGGHTVSCTITTNAVSETMGYDGIIVTNNLAFVPSPGEGSGGVGGICDSDAEFAAGTCSGTNYGPILSPVSGTVCRAAADSCDVGEECDGVSTNCPADGFATAGTACGDGSDTACTNPDSCDGVGGCLANDEAVGTICGAAGGPCDLDDTCDGAGSCTDNGFVATGTVCLAGMGPCDPDDTCDGASAGCAANFALAGTVCNAATDYCDLDDTCDGSGFCVDNGFASAGTVCRADADGPPPNGGCDAAETCTGAGPACPADDAEPDWTACDDGLFEPDIDNCFAGVCQSSGFDCGNGALDVGEQCDDGNVVNGDCCSSICQYESAGSACGSGADTICDNPDTCDGAGWCQMNSEPAGTVCLAGTGFCDPDDTCDGLGNCTVLVIANGTVCGAAAGACDLDDTCLGGACMDNGFAPAGTVCLLAGGGFCDADDTCDGAGNCDTVVAPAGTVCRADWDGPGCDAQEVCNGVSSNCPADVCETSGTFCSDPFPSTCDPSCYCGSCDCFATGVTAGWKTPSGIPIADIANIGAGDSICRDFTGGGGSCATCTVNGVSGACSYSGNRICISAATLTANLFSPTLANCSALTTAASRLRNVRIQCGTGDTGNVPAAYAMPVTDGTIGGPGNGFADGSIQVCAIDRWTGGNIGQAIGIQVEDDSTPPVILHRATIAAGNTCTTISGGSLTGALTVTAASEGYQTFTITKADAREFELPMSKRLSRERAEVTTANTWYLEGDFLATSFNSIYTAANRHGGCNLQFAPNPIRAGMAITSPYRTPLHHLSLDLLMATEVPKGLMACSGAQFVLDFPGNIASPDMMSAGTGTRANTFFEGIRVTRPTGVLVQSLGIAASPEGLRFENVERYFGENLGAGSGYAKSATPVLYYFDLMVAGQEMAVVNPGTLCPAGGRCNINSESATGVSFNIAHMPGYTHNFGTNRWQFWSWDWNSAAGSEVNIMSQFEQSTTTWFGHDPDQGLSSNPANVTAADPQDSDPVRYGADLYFDCAGDAFCYSRKHGRRAWRGFIGRDVDNAGVRLRAEQFYFYGFQVDVGLLADTFIPLNFYNGARVEGPNTNGDSATSFAPMGGPLDSTVIGYVNGLLPGAIASGRMLGLGMWFKNGERRVGRLSPLPSSALGPSGCTTVIGPRTGNCIASGWDDDNTIGIPVPVQDGLGLSPYDMGDAATVTQCVASVAPGEPCLAMSGGDVRTLGLGGRSFVFDNNSAGLAAPWGDPDLIVHALSVNGGQAFYAGVPAATPANLCVGGVRAGLPCTDLYDCQGGTCTATTQSVGSNDDAWIIVGQGPGMAGGAQQSFVLPDLAAACPSCTPSTALTVKDWRHLNNGATPGGFTDQGPGVHVLTGAEVDTCTAPGCKTAARGQCFGGPTPGIPCTADGTCGAGGVCGQTYTGLNWNMFGYGSATMNSCQTANAWHYREINAGGLGGIEEARNFSVNSADSIFNE